MLRRSFLLLTAILIIVPVFTAYAADRDFKNVLSLLDLSRPGLEKVKAEYRKGQWKKASEELLGYYRARKDIYIPGQDSRQASPGDSLWAEDALRHTFHVLKDPVWNYGKDINWEYWPIRDIEIRVQLHRHGWWTSLGKMYCTTGDEKYAGEYVREFRDWVSKNPYRAFNVDQKGTVSSGSINIDAPNECFAFRPLEVGIRLQNWSTQFSLFLYSDSFTPDFLMDFLRSYHKNASVLMKTFSPAGNHLIHQSLGILCAGLCFPEFKDAAAWVKAGTDNLNAETARQSFPDGCHFELDPGYHIGFVESYNSAIQMAVRNGRKDLFPAECLERIVRMTNYFLDYSYPDGTHPCFSDSRVDDDLAGSDLLEDVGRYDDSPSAGRVLWAATGGKQGTEPSYKSAGYPETGFYTFRSGWTSDDIIMPIKATKRGMWHAQPDFGTFELWAYGKKLMSDAGAYVYSGDEEIERQRAYFKATARHNAVTLDDRNYDDPEPRVIEWRPDENWAGVQLLSVRHEAYRGLSRRRDIAFVNEKYFVIVDHVNGTATGHLCLRNGLRRGSLAPYVPSAGTSAGASILGKVADMTLKGDLVYRDAQAGLRLLVAGPDKSVLGIDRDSCSEVFHEKFERPVVRLDFDRTSSDATQHFVTVLIPFQGDDVPEVDMYEIATVIKDLL